MRAERVRELQARHRWLPDDYVRILARIEPGERRYGVTWLDGPQPPAQAGGSAAAAQFPTAAWIGRRSGQVVGYDLQADGQPQLCEWGRSQRQVLHRFASIDALILSQIDPASDRRPIVTCGIEIPGLAFAPWRDTGAEYSAACLFSAGREQEALTHLLGGRVGDWELVLTRQDGDSWFCLRRNRGELQSLVAHHGSVGDWRPMTELEARRETVALAARNDGSLDFARFSVPRSHQAFGNPLADGGG